MWIFCVPSTSEELLCGRHPRNIVPYRYPSCSVLKLERTNTGHLLFRVGICSKNRSPRWYRKFMWPPFVSHALFGSDYGIYYLRLQDPPKQENGQHKKWRADICQKKKLLQELVYRSYSIKGDHSK